MDLILGCFLASAGLLGVGLLERITSARDAREEPVAARIDEAPMLVAVRR